MARIPTHADPDRSVRKSAKKPDLKVSDEGFSHPEMPMTTKYKAKKPDPVVSDLKAVIAKNEALAVTKPLTDKLAENPLTRKLSPQEVREVENAMTGLKIKLSPTQRANLAETKLAHASDELAALRNKVARAEFQASAAELKMHAANRAEDASVAGLTETVSKQASRIRELERIGEARLQEISELQRSRAGDEPDTPDTPERSWYYVSLLISKMSTVDGTAYKKEYRNVLHSVRASSSEAAIGSAAQATFRENEGSEIASVIVLPAEQDPA
jgi:hypothetical protein